MRLLDRREATFLCSGALLWVPIVRGVAVWPWLLGAPGWFVATRVLGAPRRGFASLVLAAAVGLALATVVQLPAILLAGGPTRVGIVASGLVASAACLAWGRRPASALAVDSSERSAPPLLFLAALVTWMAVRALVPWESDGRDGPYLEGMVRSLATSFPPVNPAACAYRLEQPWGYWMVDGLALVGGGATMVRTLALASAVYGGLFLGLAFVVVLALGGSRRAAAFSLPAYLTGWGARSQGTVESFGRTLAHATYDTPTLILFLLVALLAARARPGDEPMRPAPLAALLAVLTVLPLFHPASALLASGAVLAWLLYEAGRGGVPRLAWALPLTGVPFLVLYVHLYAPDVHARFPFVIPDAVMAPVFVAMHGARLVPYFALAVIPAALGVWATPRARRSFLLLSLGLPLAAALVTENIADNYHWTYDPLSVAVGLAVSVGLGACWERWPRGGALVASGWFVLVLFAAAARPWPSPEPRGAEATSSDTDDTNARAADFLRSRSAPGACVLARADDPRISNLVLSLGERTLYLEQPYHLDRTMDATTLAALVTRNDALLANPDLARRALSRPTFALFTGADAAAEAWSARAAPVFTAGDVRIYEMP